MKKNKMMRLASCLLVMVLLTTSMISGTFAKYVTTGDATDTARVAKWGVEVTATGNDAFDKTYKDAAGDQGTQVVSSTDDKVVAPGTSGSLGSITITGTPEVVVDVEVTADLTLTGWEINGVEYCPLVFTVGNDEIKIDGQQIKTVAELEAAVEAKLIALSADDVAANTPLDAKNVAVSWAWPFDGNDENDTALGDAAANNAARITFESSATVTQVD